MTQTRRQFLKHTGCGALSASAILSGLGRFALIDALAQSQSGYQALVCLFLFGGNDSNNVVIPYDNYADYSAHRVVRGEELAVQQDQLLPISPPSAGQVFGLHPKLGESFIPNPSVYDLFNLGRAAIVCNTGPLVYPLTRDQYMVPGFRSRINSSPTPISRTSGKRRMQTARGRRGRVDPRPTGRAAVEAPSRPSRRSPESRSSAPVRTRGRWCCPRADAGELHAQTLPVRQQSAGTGDLRRPHVRWAGSDAGARSRGR